MTRALTPAQFNALVNAGSVAAICAGTVLIACGIPELGTRIRRAWQTWKRAEDHATGCDWCDNLVPDGLTVDDCQCTAPCENRPWCAATRAELRRRT